MHNFYSALYAQRPFLHGVFLISQFGSRPNGENTFIFPGQTSPLSSRFKFPTVYLPSSGVSQKDPKLYVSKIAPILLPGFPISVDGIIVHAVMQARNLEPKHHLPEGSDLACLVFCCVFVTQNSAWPRKGTKYVLWNYCLQSLDCIHFPPSLPFLFSPGCHNLSLALLQ